MADTNRQWRLRTRPTGAIDADTFELATTDRPEPGDGEALVKVTWLSMDPTIRQWIQRDTYLPRIEEGEVVRSLGIGEVVASNSPRYAVGDLVSGTTGWQEWAIADEAQRRMQVLPAGTDPLDAVGLFGPTGLAAYFGMLRIGQPESGDTVFVSGAAGATGSVAGQIAKAEGCTVIGTAGSDEKCARVVDDYGFDACINYKEERVSSRLRELAPEGIDVFFDNVGGKVLEAGLANLALHARIVVCGAISQYDDAVPQGPRNYMNLVVKRARMEGFLIFDYVSEYGQAIADLGAWAADGTISHEVDAVDGFDNVPAAFLRLFTGDKVGKNAVRLL